MNRLLLAALAAAVQFAAAPSRADLPEFDPGPLADSLWDGHLPTPVGEPKVYTSRLYRRERKANRDMRLRVMRLRLSGVTVVKYGVKKVSRRRYVYVVSYYPADDPRFE